MPNEILEFSGVGSALIKCIIDTDIGEKTYKAKEPYTYLKDIEIHTVYQAHNASGAGRVPVVNNRDGVVAVIELKDVPLSDKVASLIMTKNNSGYSKTCKEQITCWSDGVLEITEAEISNVFCYDEDYNAVEIESVQGAEIHGNFEAQKEYLVFYDIAEASTGYNFESPRYPYFEIQLFGKGNKDKLTQSFFMKFPKVSLISSPRLNTQNGGMLSTTLTFNIIYSEKGDVPLISFE